MTATDVTSTSRDQRIVDLMPLVGRLARRLSRTISSVDYDDLVSEGMIGAIYAVDRWEPEQGDLQAFAMKRIRGAMMDFVRSHGPLSRKHYQEVKDGEKQFSLSSLDVPVVNSQGEGTLLIDLLPDDEDTIAKMLDRVAMVELVKKVPEPHRQLLEEYFFEGLSLRQMGDRWNLTESRMSQKVDRALDFAYHHYEGAAT